MTSDSESSQNVPAMETLSKGSMSGMSGDGSEIVIRNQDDFEDFWRSISGGLMNDGASVPEVDFDTFMVLGVLMGEQPSSGYDIRIESVEEQSQREELHVKVVKTEPGVNCMNMTVMTHPHHIIKLNKQDAELVFEYETIINECE